MNPTSARSLLRRMRLGVVALCVLIVILAVASAPVSEAQDEPLRPGASPQRGAVAQPLRGNSLVAKAQAQGTVKVIVWLNTPFTAEGALAQREGQQIAASASVRNQRAQIATLKSTLVRQLTGQDVRVTANWESLPGLAVTTDARGLQALLSSPLVSAVYEDVAYPPTLGYTLPLINASTPGTGAWAQGVDGTNFAVAVLDTGALANHQFLSGQVVREFCFSSEGATSASLCPGAVNFASGAGTASPFPRCVTLTGDPTQCDHGTHVSGTVAGNYGPYSGGGLLQPIQMGGVAKGADLIVGQVFSYVFDCNAGTPGNQPCVSAWNSDIVSALDYIYNTLASTGPGTGAYNIASVNLSLGAGQNFGLNCDTTQGLFQGAMANLRSVGIAPVVASGNDSYVDALSAPACVSAAVSVGATEVNYLSGPISGTVSPGWPTAAFCGGGCYGSGVEQIAFFSNGSAALELLAPGYFVESAVLGSTSSVTGQFARLAGTSMAAPHVAGAWAVLKQQSPVAPVDRILTTLQTSGVPFVDNAYTGNTLAATPAQTTYRVGASGITFRRIDLGAAVTALGRDWGDAPNSYGTTSASNGPRHIRVPEYVLGAAADSEADGTPGTDDGDDGVAFPTMTIGTTVNVNVSTSVAQQVGVAPNSTYLGRLYAWIDFNRDGDFADAGEQVASGTLMTGPYPQAIPVAIPAGATAGDTWARFRYSTQTGLSYTGQAYNGEVEDYQISLTAASAPEIAVEANTGPTEIFDGGSYNLGTTTVGTPITQTFTVRNTGSAALVISTNPPTVTGNFTATTFSRTGIPAGQTATFSVTCTATAAGNPVTGTISFANNDVDENPFNFTVTCTVNAPPAPEIAVEANTGPTSIADGGSYDLGTTTLGTTISETFTVRNIGTADLTVTSPATTTGDFTAGAFSATTIPAAGTATFTVTCGATALGAPSSGTVSFANNDADENPFNFTVTCIVNAVPVPEIEVEANTGPTPITDGGSYDLGTTALGAPISETFTVRNTGTADLTVTSPATTTGDFTASAFSATTIAPAATATFTVTCDATAAGSPVTGTVSFANNDADENPFNFTVTCTVNPVPVPEIEVEANTGPTSITDGGSYDLGTTALGAPISETFTVRNIGTADLTVTSPATTTGDFTAGAFSVTTIPAAGTATFTVTCDATALGTPVTGTVSFANNDADENPFNFTVTCSVTEVPAPGYGSAPPPGSTITLSTTPGVPATNTVVISETGNTTLTISSYAMTTGTQITVSGAAAPFDILDSGASQTLTLTCDAAAEGNFTDMLTVTHNAIGSPATYTVTCTVAAAPVPEIEVEANTGPTSIADGGRYDLGTTTLGTTISETFTVRNTGTADLTVTSPATTTGDFTAGAFSAATIAPAATATFTVTCDATAAGSPVTGTVSFANNDADENPFNFTVTCTVTAAPAPGYDSVPAPGSTITLSTTPGVPTTDTVLISETGNATLTISSYAMTTGVEITVSGPAAPFDILDGGASQTLTLTCDAAAEGNFTDTLTVTHDAIGSPATYTVTCTVAVDVPPTVTSTTPADGAVDVPVDTTIVLRFSEPVDIAFTGILLECPAGTPIAYDSSPALPANGVSSITLTPLAALPTSTLCQVSALASGIADGTGNALDGSADGTAGDNYIFSFTTSATPPVPTPQPTGEAGAQIDVFDPAISKLGVLEPGALGLPGEQITWTVTVSNNGSAAGINVVVTDTLRPELRIDSVESTAGSFVVSGQTVTLTIPVLNPGDVVSMRITTTVLRGPADGVITNTAAITGQGVTKSTDAAVSVPSLLPKTGYPAKSSRPAAWVWVLLAGAATVALIVTSRAHLRRKAG